MMFYTQLFTSRRGPLAKIWLAAHWERKLTKTHVFECNLETTIKDIMSPKMPIGLRTSGHLLLGVVRIYSRKAKYLLADCNDALLKIKMAFRPGQTDLPQEGLEATRKAITLMEDFTAFDAQLPPLNNIDVVDHFSTNQCRSEEITLKEELGNSFFFADIGGMCEGHHNILLDISFQGLAQDGDAFGDEDNGLDLLDFLTNSSDNAESTDILQEPQNEQSFVIRCEQVREDPVEVETTLNETTLLANLEEAFALEPVPISTNSQRKKGKRKRKLVVDVTKALTNEFIRQQLSDYSDLVAPFEMAPPTVQLMEWKESGGADKLLTQPCSTIASLEIKELFKSFFQVKYLCEEVEQIRQNGHELQRDLRTFRMDQESVVPLSLDTEITHSADLTIDRTNTQLESLTEFRRNEIDSEFTYPELPSEDSMFVHPSQKEQETQSTSLHSQSMLDGQDFKERKITRQAKKLLNILQGQSNSETMVSLQSISGGCNRLQAATAFFCLLVLKKQKAIHLQQIAPYQDIFVTLGPTL